MILSEIFKRASKMVADNSPTILSSVAVAGTVTTAYLAAIAGIKTARVLANDAVFNDTTPKEKVQLCWKLYIPSIGTGALTVACIIFANRIGTRRAEAIAAAFLISEKAFGEYREKIVERIGSSKEQKYRDEIAQERVDRDPVDNKQVIVTDSGSVLCYDAYTGRYFMSDMETLRKAENDINAQIIHDSYASLSDLYDLIELPHTSNSDEVGWNADRLLKITFSTTLSPLGKPCIVIDYNKTLIRNYDRSIS